MTTEFASPHRSNADEIDRQSHLFDRSTQIARLVSLFPDPVLILNRNRQIVLANSAAAKIVRQAIADDPVGLRPGEALQCEHALEAECGCGTSSFCRYCGAVQAILASLKGTEDAQECLIAQRGGETLAFMCHTYPLPIGEEVYSLFVLKDIGKEKRVDILEHVFFHDIKNLLTVLRGWVELLKRADGPEQTREIGQVLSQLSTELVDEVNAQETLLKAESRLLGTSISTFDSLSVLKEVENLHGSDEGLNGRRLVTDPGAHPVQIKSDASLLKRVLGNMVRNAIEASGAGDIITMGCLAENGQVTFWVHNPGIIPPEVQSQIFKWSYSTKGKGRGLGTYSMRLLTERYLGGKVSFTSTPENGTRFEATYPLVLG